MTEQERRHELTKAQLLDRLRKCASLSDFEKGHREADELLIAYINDEDVTAAYDKIDKWYA